MLAKLHALAQENANWKQFVEALITDYSRRIEAGDSADEAYRLLREFGEVMSLEALETQVRLMARQRTTADHAVLLLQVALRRATAEQLRQWIEENPGWITALPPEWRRLFESGAGSLDRLLITLPESERPTALLKLGKILQARGQIAALAEPAVIGKFAAIGDAR